MTARPYKCPYCEVEGRTEEAIRCHIEVCHPGRRKRVKRALDNRNR